MQLPLYTERVEVFFFCHQKNIRKKESIGAHFLDLFSLFQKIIRERGDAGDALRCLKTAHAMIFPSHAMICSSVPDLFLCDVAVTC